ncbi:MAG: hypothetical protein ACI8PZ_004758 [Myxococcota bacterium]
MRLASVLLLACMWRPALAAPADALEPIPRRLYDDARRLEATGELQKAAMRYRKVWELEPTFHHAVVDLGRVLAAANDPGGAAAALELAPWDGDAVEALGHLLLDSERPVEALEQFKKLRKLRPGWNGGRLLEAEAALAFDSVLAADLLSEYLERPGVRPSSEAVGLGVRVAERLRRHAQAERSRALVEQLGRLDLAVPERELLAELEHRARVEADAEMLRRAANQPLLPDQERTLEAARAALGRGDPAAAIALLADVLEQSPLNAEAWGTQASAHEATGMWAMAERALATAEVLDPLSAEWPARRGRLLYDRFAGRFDLDALAGLDRALQRPGASAEVWLDRAWVLRSLGRAADAAASARTYVEQTRDGWRADEAARFLEGAERRRLPPPEIPPAPGRPASVPEAAWTAFHLALAHRRFAGPSDLEAALEQLEITRELTRDWPEALNLEAEIRQVRDEPAAAIMLYERSLAARPGQIRVMELLAQLYAENGRDEASAALLLDAAERGSAASLYALARAAWQAGDLLEARDHLERYFSSTASGPEYAAALELRVELDRWIRGAATIAGTSIAVGAGLPLAVWVRRRSGHGLRELLERVPETYRDVARTCAAIRHEVIKHNTTVLRAVADALDARDPEPALWAADRLFGPRGAAARFAGLVAELERLGRAHGVRLNLRHRDPTLGPLIAAMERLEALQGDLRGGRGHRRTAELRDLAVVLNVTGYRALGLLLRRVCLLELEAALVREAWQVALAELRPPAQVSLDLRLPPDPVLVRMFRADFHDILVNLLRNSLEVTIEAGATRVGVSVDLEEDPVTFLELVRIRVSDDSPKRLSTAMIRGRYIGRGLGLAVDLISRSGGSVHVEAHPGWAKAVAIRLPRVESTGEEG